MLRSGAGAPSWRASSSVFQTCQRFRNHVRRLPRPVDGCPDQPGDEVLVSVRRPVQRPTVIRSVVGGGGRFEATHLQMPISWLTGILNLKIVAPSTPADAKGLLKASIRDENPVVLLNTSASTRSVEKSTQTTWSRLPARGSSRGGRGQAPRSGACRLWGDRDGCSFS
jgi:hypothetical protein